MSHPDPARLYDPYQAHTDDLGQGYNPYAPEVERKDGYAQNQRRALKEWRHDHHRPLWTKGGRGRCIGRFCCCSVMTVLFFLISIVLALLLWVRPPDVIVGNVGAQSTGGEIQLVNDGVQLNLALNITVNNPNYFSVSFSSINADIYYPIGNTLVGGGNQSSVTFPSHSNTTFTFPFSIAYTTTMPSSTEILADLISKCGLEGGTRSDITVDYVIKLNVNVLFITVSPTISNSASFLCPLTSSDVLGLIGGTG